MDRVKQLNPFASRESHDGRSLLFLKFMTVVSYLLVVVTSVVYSVEAPEGGHNHRKIWKQNKAHPSPFSLNPFITDIYWIILFVLQAHSIYFLFSSKVEFRTAAANVGGHHVVFNLLHFAFLLLWVNGHFVWAELILIINFFNLMTLYFRHPKTRMLVHIPTVSAPLAWTFVALFWNGAAMVGAHHLAARIVANVAIWSLLGFGLVFLAAFQDYTMGFAMSVLTASLAVHQFLLKVVALQWIFAFVIMSVLFLTTLGITVPKYFGKDVSFSHGNVIVEEEDGETRPLLDDA